MANDTTPRTVTAQIGRAVVDRTQWKSYNPELWFQNLFVTFQVPETEIVVDSDGNTTITLDGFCLYVLDQFASSLEAMHKAFKIREAKTMEDLNTKSQIKQGEQK